MFLSEIFQKSHSEVHLLTVKEKYIPAMDYSLPIPGIIHRVGMYPSYPINKTQSFFKRVWNRLWEDYLCIVDSYSGWIVPAVIKGLRIIQYNKIDLIIATGPPFSSVMIGSLLSLVTKTKIILDYRDPWNYPSWNYCRNFGKRINEVLERVSARNASALTFCSQTIKEHFGSHMGKYTQADSYIVPNGFKNNEMIEPLSLDKVKQNMVYAGNFYGERSIKLLVKPLCRLLDENAVNDETFCFHLFGTEISDEDRKVISKYGLQHIIKEHHPVPYEQAMRYLKGADILFLPSGSDVKYAIPFKFYDYLSVKRPIFAVAPADSAVAELMNKIDCGEIAPINSEKAIFDKLRMMLLDKKEYTYSGIQQYTWDEISHKYLQIIDKVESAN